MQCYLNYLHLKNKVQVLSSIKYALVIYDSRVWYNWSKEDKGSLSENNEKNDVWQTMS